MLDINIIKTFREAFAPSAKLEQKKTEVSGDYEKLLDEAEKFFDSGDFGKAAMLVSEASKSVECNPCQRKLLQLSTDITQTGIACLKKGEQCEELKQRNKRKIEFYRSYYIPRALDLMAAAKEKES